MNLEYYYLFSSSFRTDFVVQFLQYDIQYIYIYLFNISKKKKFGY